MSTEYTVPCKGILASDQHTWTWTDLLTRGPKEDEFLVEMIATGVCHTDISGYGGIYPRILGHEGKKGHIAYIHTQAKHVALSYSSIFHNLTSPQAPVASSSLEAPNKKRTGK
jgi:hypothetical protein